MSGQPHPGPRIDKIPVAGAAGLLFVAVTVLIFVTGVPPIRWFLLGSLALGLLLAILLVTIHKS